MTTGVLDKPRRAVPSDTVTVASLAVLAYAAANVLHEGLGHGGACLLVGGTPRLLASVSFDCAAPSVAGERVVAAAGTIVNLVVGGLAAWAYRSAAARGPALRFFLWLFATINVMQGFGYFLFSGVGRIGDWADVMAGVQPEWVWRATLAIAGGALYYLATVRAFRALGRFIGGLSSDRFPIGQRLSLLAYATGAALYGVAGMLNPGGALLLLVSAAAASLGGTSGLAWGPTILRASHESSSTPVPTRIARDGRLVAVAVVVAVVFIFVLGPGIRFN